MQFFDLGPEPRRTPLGYTAPHFNLDLGHENLRFCLWRRLPLRADPANDGPLACSGSSVLLAITAGPSERIAGLGIASAVFSWGIPQLTSHRRYRLVIHVRHLGDPPIRLCGPFVVGQQNLNRAALIAVAPAEAVRCVGPDRVEHRGASVAVVDIGPDRSRTGASSGCNSVKTVAEPVNGSVVLELLEYRDRGEDRPVLLRLGIGLHYVLVDELAGLNVAVNGDLS